ncbi:mitochondrial small ribosomal subunit Rsm22-domain-containing protein [Halenospora varia]|nr:mitochondrial small ribosomal subunit Rsm22-domain-containing protein [Halenospora varia]
MDIAIRSLQHQSPPTTMLTARKAPRACQSCRLQLLSLFEYGFTNPTKTVSRARYSTILEPRPRTFQPRNNAPLRRFTSARVALEDFKPAVAEPSPADIEAVVREARQTFGETLPKDYLSAEEYTLYERLYGPPVRETRPEDLEYLPVGEEEIEEADVRNVLLRENGDGEYEEIEFDPALGYTVEHEDRLFAEEVVMEDEAQEEAIGFDSEEGINVEVESALPDVPEPVAEASEDSGIRVQGRNQREVDAIARLQKDMDAAMARAAEEEEEDIDEEYEEEIEEEEEELEEDEPDAYVDSDAIRSHPHTLAARSGTFPATVSLPREQIIEPISELLARTNIKHIREAAEKVFGGPGLPYSTMIPSTKKHLPQRHIGLDAAQHRMSEVDADAYLAAVMPGTYAAVVSTIVETRKRLGAQWLRDLLLRKGEGPRVLDAGAGGGGAIAWREVLQAEWDVMKEEGLVKRDTAPIGKTTVLTGANTLRHRISRMLENTTFLPRLPDYVHASRSKVHIDGADPQARKVYDIVIAPHSLFPLKEEWRRKQLVENLWSLLDPKGGVLILLEKGLPRGFEAIAGARELLLENHISSPHDTTTENEIESSASDHARFRDKEDGMIVAPCTNHTKCPLYLTPGLSSGRKDLCHFSQRFIRPPYLQQVLGASVRNHDDVKFSYLAVRRGVDARKAATPILQGDAATDQSFEGYEEYDLPVVEGEVQEPSDIKFNSLALPRAILPPLKRRGHVTLDLCTPSGKLERWTVPKSFSRTAYRDARKSKWGDLWALGAKTRVHRSARLGHGLEQSGKGGKMKGVRDGRQGKGGKKVKKNKFNVIMGPDGFEGIEQDRSQSKFVRPEKRTKGGRIWKGPPKPIGEDDI